MPSGPEVTIRWHRPSTWRMVQCGCTFQIGRLWVSLPSLSLIMCPTATACRRYLVTLRPLVVIRRSLVRRNWTRSVPALQRRCRSWHGDMVASFLRWTATLLLAVPTSHTSRHICENTKGVALLVFQPTSRCSCDAKVSV